MLTLLRGLWGYLVSVYFTGTDQVQEALPLTDVLSDIDSYSALK